MSSSQNSIEENQQVQTLYPVVYQNEKKNVEVSGRKKETKMASSMLSSSSKQKTNYALAISHIVKELIASYESGATLNLTKLKGDAAKKFSLQG